MHEIASADRAKLARGEETGHRNVSERTPHRVDVVIGLAEKAHPSAVAREEERSGHR